MDESLTVEDVKARAQAMELRIADGVPKELVDRVEQNEFGVLAVCDTSERLYAWTGVTRVHLVGEFDTAAGDALTKRIVGDLGGIAEDGYVVGTSAATEWLAIEILNQNGEFYSASTTPTGFEISGQANFLIASRSQCFRLPADVDPGMHF
ncbi:hypothetical protein [Microbacterium imperiale]|uniref:Uncharacterized protein n=1 Tax=Microbacterium imperiale TaxID=33884 RepID=A0A9W6HDK3_9MICO|nr:hypothetical protein [Microbacterium imperiale]MBP2420139.1 hypothetical protein [Microbacterium imperiale]MDS0197998.1 hypothetical protein [Microbacterium imperiale]BFE40480.1 hypothetical protein GCM10017544_14360 [Microbacterium imperiale]GLJ78544.1 hypothetical protein GCM10017586_02260 [Microbacterium imperiale]